MRTNFIFTRVAILLLLAIGQTAWAQTTVNIDNEADLRSYLQSTTPYSLKLMHSISLTQKAEVRHSDKTIDLNGHAIDCGNYYIEILDGGSPTLTIKDTFFPNTSGTIFGGNGNNNKGCAFYVRSTAKLVIQSGIIKGNRTAGYVADKGAIIYNCGTLEITGGTISDGNANRGGAIFNDGGTVTISQGTVTVPTSITNNTATQQGGAIYNNGGTVTISNSNSNQRFTITNNTATENGGAIYNSNSDINHSAVLNVTGGSISNNSALNGGGIYCNSGTLNMSGTPVVSNNTGGGIYCNSGTLNMSGKPVVADNTGSNVYLPSGQYINVDGAFTSGANVGVTRADGLVNGYGDFTSDYATNNPSTAPANVFHSDYNGYEVNLHNGEASFTEIFASYIDEDGVEKTHAVIPLTGSETSLGQGWYFVNSNLNYTSSLSLPNNIHLILADGVTLNTLAINGYSCDLTLYGQSQGTGALVLTVSSTLGSLTMNGGNITINNSSYNALDVGNLTINRGTIDVTSNSTGINIYDNYIQNGGSVTVNSNSSGGLYADDFTFNNGTLNVTSNQYSAIHLHGNASILGGQVTAIGATGYYGINTNGGNITLGWTNPSDFITVSSYHLGSGTLTVANGKTLQYEDGGETHTISGTVTNPGILDGKTLTPLIPPVTYIDSDGTENTCNNYTVLTGGSATTLTEGWYVVDDDITYTGTLTLAGNVTLILCNGKTMTVNPGSDHSIIGDGVYTLTVYGQTLYSDAAGTLQVINGVGGKTAIYWCTYTQHSGNVIVNDSNDDAIDAEDFTLNGGTLTATGNSGIIAYNVTINGGIVNATGNCGICAYNDVTINGGTVNATGTDKGIRASNGVTINGGAVNATGTNYGIWTGNVTINGGTVNVTGEMFGIYADDNNKNTILGWTSPNDYILVNQYEVYGTISVKSGQAFYYEDYGETVIISGTLNNDQISAIRGRTLRPYALTPVAYIDENGVEQQCTLYTVVTNDLDFDNLPAGWYVVSNDITLERDVHFTGDAHLILCDDATMSISVGELAPELSITPDAINETLGENDMTNVEITINNDGNSISDWAGWLDFGDGGTTGTQTADLYYHNGEVASGIGSSDAYTREMGIRLPATAYAGAAMGMRITSVQYYIRDDYQSADHNYTFRIYGQGLHNQPGELLAEKTINSSAAGQWITATFDEEIYMTGQAMWATVQLEQAAGEYPLSMDGGEYGEESDGNWLSTNDSIFCHCYSAGSYGGVWMITVNCQGELIPGTWATINQTEGSIMGGQSEAITLTLNSIGLEAGTYNANLIINTNDVENPQFLIPVALNVTNDSKETVNQLSGVYPIPATSRCTLGGRDTNDGIGSGNALLSDGALTLYGQSGGSGSLTAISGYGSSIDANNLTINGGIVNATGTDRGIEASNVTINGGTLTANEIYSPTVTLGWSNTNDNITVGSFAYSDTPTVSVKSGQVFYYEAGSETVIVSGTLNATQITAIGGETLRPYFVSRTVAGYGNDNDKWVFISSPVSENIAPAAVSNLQSDNYDLYRFNQSDANGNEWQNYKATTSSNHPDFTSLVNGQGYLYATEETKTLVFSGTFNTDNTKTVNLVYDNTAGLKGWNLVGNPFVVDAYVNRPFYRMNAAGTGIEPIDTYNDYTTPVSIPACTGIMVQAGGGNETVVFSTSPSGVQSAPNQGNLQIALSQVVELADSDSRFASLRGGTTKQSTIDKAIVSFNEGAELGKFYFGEQNANIYIPQGHEEYAIAFSEGQGEMPLNFKAKENGTYTITVNPEGVEMGYLHLIDNLTGADVDLLPPLRGGQGESKPASYTFTAKTTDYASRFRLVFASVCEDADGDNAFAFISNGNIIVNGTGSLQIFDALGRQVFTKELSTVNSQLSTANFSVGVYVLRLIEGDDVRTQKIVIE